MRKLLLALCALAALVLPAAAQAAKWGPKSECGGTSSPNTHCYALSERNVAPYGGVLASIDFVDTDYNTYPTVNIPESTGGGENFVTNEEWIEFGTYKGKEGWIETGQIMGAYGGSPQYRVEIHPFYAEEIYYGSDWNNGNGTFHKTTAEYTLPAGGAAFTKANPSTEAYNHYVLFDPEQESIWRIYWGCCEVASYGGGWPAFLQYQESGIEAADEYRPTEYGRDEVADSDGGTWTPWEHDTWYNGDKGICLEANEEDHNEGDVEWGTQCDL
jgi:hypothetical protein